VTVGTEQAEAPAGQATQSPPTAAEMYPVAIQVEARVNEVQVRAPAPQGKV